MKLNFGVVIIVYPDKKKINEHHRFSMVYDATPTYKLVLQWVGNFVEKKKLLSNMKVSNLNHLSKTSTCCFIQYERALLIANLYYRCLPVIFKAAFLKNTRVPLLKLIF